MFLTIARLTGSIATGIVLNLLVNYLRIQKENYYSNKDN